MHRWNLIIKTVHKFLIERMRAEQGHEDKRIKPAKPIIQGLWGFGARKQTNKEYES